MSISASIKNIDVVRRAVSEGEGWVRLSLRAGLRARVGLGLDLGLGLGLGLVIQWILELYSGF